VPCNINLVRLLQTLTSVTAEVTYRESTRRHNPEQNGQRCSDASCLSACLQRIKVGHATGDNSAAVTVLLVNPAMSPWRCSG
jgi:hypothetical protein